MPQVSVERTPPFSPRPPYSTIDVTHRCGAPTSVLRTRSMWMTKSMVSAIRLHTAYSGSLVLLLAT